ncbi:MAG: pilus assembly protein [Dehalococcoidia bacterium]|nr:pilus assembly protein [Dehalococcoidia bacterium]
MHISPKEPRGQGLVEYGLIIFLIAIVVIVALSTLATPIGQIYSSIATVI